MEQFVVSARKYRPDTFESVVGQRHVTQTLRNALKGNSLAHAYLFCGPRGVGKTTCARILAKAVNCKDLQPNGDPCNHCDSCTGFNEGRSLNIFELDAASNNGVEDIRGLIERLRFIPQSGSRSVYIIDEVHMLSTAAFNAFLKTLEEPPEHALFILATTEKHKILPTILSRCQKFDFRRIAVEHIAEHLAYISKEENIPYEPQALHLISVKADGGLRDALSMYDQLVSSGGGSLTLAHVQESLNVLDDDLFFKLVALLRESDHAGALLLFNDILEKGFEPAGFLTGWVSFLRNMLVGLTQKTIPLLEVPADQQQRFLEAANSMPPSYWLNAFNLASEAEQQIRQATSPRWRVELLLLKLAHLQNAVNLAALAADPAKKKFLNERLLQAQAAGGPVPVPSNVMEATVMLAPEDRIAAATPTPQPDRAQDAGASRRKTSPSIPTDLNSARNFEIQKTEEEKQAEFDPDAVAGEAIALTPEAFQAMLEDLKASTRDKRPMIFGALNLAHHRVEGNKWIVETTTAVGYNSLKEAKPGLVPYLRQRTGNPTLLMDLRLVEETAETTPTAPNTGSQGILEAMAQENPSLLELLGTFAGMLEY